MGAFSQTAADSVMANDAGIRFIAPIQFFKIDGWNCQIDVTIRGLHGVAAGLKCSSRRGVNSSTTIPFSGSRCSRLEDVLQRHATSLIGTSIGHFERQDEIEIPITQHVIYRSVKVDELLISYREGGWQTILLLDGPPA